MERLSQGLDLLSNEVEGFFQNVLTGRDALLCNLRDGSIPDPRQGNNGKEQFVLNNQCFSSSDKEFVQPTRLTNQTCFPLLEEKFKGFPFWRLPEGLVDAISKRVPVVSAISMGAACETWRCVLASVPPTQKKLGLPWLMLCGQNDSECNDYSNVVSFSFAIPCCNEFCVGCEQATSKFHCLAELDVPSENFGFRGEAISSLSDISLLEGCKCLYLGIDDNRQEMGTTETVEENQLYGQIPRGTSIDSENLFSLSLADAIALVILLMILVAACRPHNPPPFSEGALDKPGIVVVVAGIVVVAATLQQYFFSAILRFSGKFLLMRDHRSSWSYIIGELTRPAFDDQVSCSRRAGGGSTSLLPIGIC
ncbi:hypothetical protein IFM89_023730 [Coptis chinensis]|uniref:F-box domain-containing protein n=1 Tax=Coptis chinensis TaxID=261450 RepID=A0A835M3X5_9MAGN|nr:hypothetical protein IFM89_023730 [Coptis chinensis]